MNDNLKELVDLLTSEEKEELKQKRKENHGDNKNCCLGSGCSGNCIKKILENRNKKENTV